jgi:hypothetical protein
MTLFAVHDESGRLQQANKVYDIEGYNRLLDDRGLKYVTAQTEAIPKPDAWWVDVSAKALLERPVLSALIDRRTIKAGGVDSAVIVGIPKAAAVTILAAGSVLHNFKPIGATEVEISIPVPCIYTVVIDLWPYRTWTTTIEAVS